MGRGVRGVVGPMANRVLTRAQVEQFIECGYTRLEEALPRAQALAAQDFLWERVAERGPRREDRATWTQPMVHIKEAYSDPVFQACATERLANAIEDLVGEGRWATRGQVTGWGWWPINFALGADHPWDVPTGGWHWDGQHFRHYVDAPNQGLLLLCLFSEIRHHGGGTVVAEGSHRVVADFLHRHPDGLELGEAIGQCNRSHPWLAELTGTAGKAGAVGDIYATGVAPAAAGRIERFMTTAQVDAAGRRLRVVETTGNPGDVLLCHPFLYHAAAQNHLGVPRFMCNRTTPLRERMDFARSNPADHSPLEVSIREALRVG